MSHVISSLNSVRLSVCTNLGLLFLREEAKSSSLPKASGK